MKFINSLKLIAIFVIISSAFAARLRENTSELLDSEYNTVKYFINNFKYSMNQYLIFPDPKNFRYSKRKSHD
jgi:hypothetical protein